MSIYEMGWIAAIYAFLGWCTEVVFAAVNKGRFVNRGFLNGPVCPIYGVGILLVVLLLGPVKDNLLLLYVGSVLLTTVVELVTGFVMEKAFHHRWWDYSKMPLNIGGYVCLQFSLLWGVACVLVVDVIHPLIQSFIDWIPHTVGTILLIVFTVTFLADLILTILKTAGLDRRLAEIDRLAALLRVPSDGIGEGVAKGAIRIKKAGQSVKADAEQKTEALTRRREALMERLAKEYKRYLAAFPDLSATRHEDAFRQLKAWLAAQGDKRGRKQDKTQTKKDEENDE